MCSFFGVLESLVFSRWPFVYLNSSVPFFVLFEIGVFLAIFFFPPGPRQFHSLLIFFLLHIQLPVRRRVNKSKSKLQADRFWHLTGSQLGAEKKAK